ncbi:hypothetical protein ACVBKF_22585, partial [Shewanella sp. 0m-11]
ELLETCSILQSQWVVISAILGQKIKIELHAYKCKYLLLTLSSLGFYVMEWGEWPQVHNVLA